LTGSIVPIVGVVDTIWVVGVVDTIWVVGVVVGIV